MNLFSKIFKNKDDKELDAKGNTEEYVTLIRIYLQSVMALQLGITNLSYLPDLAKFKRTMGITTVNGKVGVAEKSRARKILSQYYGMSDSFFAEIEGSVKKNCKNINSLNSYFFQFQGFSNDLLLLMGNLMQWKFRVPSIFKSILKGMTEKTIHDILTKPNFKAVDVQKTAGNVRKYKETLGFSEAWIVEFVYNVIMLAKKEKKSDQK